MKRKIILLMLCTLIVVFGVSCSSNNDAKDSTNTKDGEDFSNSVNEKNNKNEKGWDNNSITLDDLFNSETDEEDEPKTEEELLIEEQYAKYAGGTKWFTEEDRDWLIEATFDFGTTFENKTIIFQYIDEVDGEDYFYYYTTNYRGEKVLEHTGYVFDEDKLYGFAHNNDYIIYESVTDCIKAQLEELKSTELLKFGKTLPIPEVLKALEFEESDVEKVEVFTEDNYNFEVDYYIDNTYVKEWISNSFPTVNGANLISVEDIYIRATIGDFLGQDRVYRSNVKGTCIYEVNGEKHEAQISIIVDPLNNRDTPYQRLKLFERNPSHSEDAETMFSNLWKELDRRKRELNTIFFG